MYGDAAASIFLASLKPQSKVLDIGAGRETGFKRMLEKAGHEHVPLDLSTREDWEGHIRNRHYHAYDGVWMSHVLEHMLDTHQALTKVHSVLRQDGVLGITVPPLKHQIVGGHVSLWNAGLLLYRLVLAGFDCRSAAVKTYGYNCSVVLRRWPAPLISDLAHDKGDIAKIAYNLPIKVKGDSFDGQITEVNWGPV